MRRNSSSFWIAAAIAMAAAGRADACQDLFQRARQDRENGSAGAQAYRGRDRLDLRVSGTLPQLTPDRGSARLGIDASFESDFACGRFDVKAQIRQLVSKEARDDFLDALLGALESELARNALVLACEASPTACQAFQHFRVNANAMLGVNYDRCQAIESAINDSLQSIRAGAQKDCIEEKRRAGLSMQDALAACQNASTMRDRTGRQVAEINVPDELRRAFGLGDVDFANLQSLLSGLRITPGGARGEVKQDAVLEKFDRLEKDYRAAWSAVLQRLSTEGSYVPPSSELAKLWPPGASALTAQDVARIAKHPADKRDIYVRRVAAQAALLDLTLQVQKAERMLRAARSDPNSDEGMVKLLDRQVEDLRQQLAHIEELSRRYDEWNRTLLSTAEAADMREAEGAARNLVDAQREAKRKSDCVPEYGRRSCDVANPGGGRR